MKLKYSDISSPISQGLTKSKSEKAETANRDTISNLEGQYESTGLSEIVKPTGHGSGKKFCLGIRM